MKDWQHRFHEFIAEWLREVKKLPCASVDYVETEAEEWFDYSEAHGYSTVMNITWIDTEGKRRTEYFSGGIEDLFWRG